MCLWFLVEPSNIVSVPFGAQWAKRALLSLDEEMSNSSRMCELVCRFAPAQTLISVQAAMQR